MRTRRTVTISLPRELLAQMEQVRKAEHRTTSELIREAWRTYFAMRRTPVYTPTPRELRAIAKGRAEFRRGQSLTLAQLDAYLDRSRDQASAKGSRSRPKARPRTPARRAS
jgi:Arc/MetJ-type ribon-helix-helix transcriptional regulator